jgi:hypothetical protein
MTKRQLGFLFTAMGLLAIVALFVVDATGASRFDGIGPVQRMALSGAVLLSLVGLTLIPFGDRPA